MLPIAGRWFERQKMFGGVTLLWEPHVIPLMRCNIWHLSGRDRDLLVDSGLGIASLADEIGDLVESPVLAVATHGHDDHIGSHYEFDDVLVHRSEARRLEQVTMTSLDIEKAWGVETIESIRQAGYAVAEPHFVTALPEGLTIDGFRQRSAVVTRTIDEGDVVDLGDRHFEVLHLPGHSPGSIGLWEAASGILFSGDAVYDGPLLDELHGSNITDYCATMKRLLELPVDVVHAGHDPSFGRDRLRHLARSYLDRRDGPRSD